MLQKRRIGRSRKALALERLEDRLVLSGNVTVMQNPLTGEVLIQGDNGNNCIQINATNNLGYPTLSVRGASTSFPFVPNNVTAVNSIAGGVANIPFATVSKINIVDGNGTNCIFLGNVTGFSIPGNINITVGTGVDTISLNNIVTNAGTIRITGQGGSTDTISETNVIAGQSVITTGNGGAKVTQTNVTIGIDTITTGNGGDTISITDSRFAPPPRAYAIGMLNVTTNGGDDNVNINNVLVGPFNIIAGSGNNTIKFNASTMQQGTITTGTETAGSQGSNTVDVSNDIVTGSFLKVNILNQSGVSGVLADGVTKGIPLTNRIVNTLTMNNVQFTGGGSLTVRADDAGSYFNAGNNTNISGSSVVMTLIDTTGDVTVTVGDNYELIALGQGTPGLNDIDANNLTLTADNGLDVVIVSALLTGELRVKLGNLFDTGNGAMVFPAPPMVLINGTSAQADITLGSNTAAGPVTGWPVTISETIKGHDAYNGNLTIQGPGTAAPLLAPNGTGFGDNGLAFSVTNTATTGSTSITIGNGGPHNFESLLLSKVITKDLTIYVNSAVTDKPDTVPAGVYITLDTVVVFDTNPIFNPIPTLPPAIPQGNLLIQDVGHGVDIVSLSNVNVLYGLMVALSDSNMNVLSAQNVTAAFGQIDGGGIPVPPPGTPADTTSGNVYEDLGGNFGYYVTDFVGHDDP